MIFSYVRNTLKDTNTGPIISTSFVFFSNSFTQPLWLSSSSFFKPYTSKPNGVYPLDTSECSIKQAFQIMDYTFVSLVVSFRTFTFWVLSKIQEAKPKPLSTQVFYLIITTPKDKFNLNRFSIHSHTTGKTYKTILYWRWSQSSPFFHKRKITKKV